jgi:hypothetical protein
MNGTAYDTHCGIKFGGLHFMVSSEPDTLERSDGRAQAKI